VRGIISLGFLERLEAQARQARGGDPDYRLCDDFDLIGGTSTGSIIATGLALGFPVAKLIDLYLNLAKRAFGKRRWYGGVLVPKFNSAGLRTAIEEQVQDRTLGSEDLRTGLAIVAKRFDTGSPWVLHNNPRGHFFHPPADDPEASANKDMRLADLLRASTAAPTYYEPETIAVATGVIGLFIDGGVSPYNNPALLLFMMASSQAYGFGWPVGADKLALVSIGTGSNRIDHAPESLAKRMSALQAADALRSMIDDCSWQAQAVLQWLGQCAAPWTIDRAVGTFADEYPTPGALLDYARYDIRIEQDWITQVLGRELSASAIKELLQIDRPQSIETLLELARLAAAVQMPDKPVVAEAG